MFYLDLLDRIFTNRAHGSDPDEFKKSKEFQTRVDRQLVARGDQPTNPEDVQQPLGEPRDGFNAFDSNRTSTEVGVLALTYPYLRLRRAADLLSFSRAYYTIDVARRGIQFTQVAKDAGLIGATCTRIANCYRGLQYGAYAISAPVARLLGGASYYLRAGGTLLTKVPYLGSVLSGAGRIGAPLLRFASAANPVLAFVGFGAAVLDCGSDISRAIRTGDTRDIGNAVINTTCTVGGTVIGGVIGSFIGCPWLGAMIGGSIGNLVGNVLKAVLPEGVTRAIGSAAKWVGNAVSSVAKAASKLLPWNW